MADLNLEGDQSTGLGPRFSGTIRPATSADEEGVWPLAGELATSAAPTRDAFADSFRAILLDPGATIFVAIDQGEVVVGYVHVLAHAAFHANGNKAWVEELVVASDRRGAGCGRQLMAAAEHWAQSESQAAYVALATRRAAAFYQPIGYVESAAYLKKSLAD